MRDVAQEALARGEEILDALGHAIEVRGERGDSLLVIHDLEDREVKVDHGHALAATWPNARLLATTGLGHRRILRDDAVIAAALELLREGIQPPVSDLVREVDRQLESR